MSLFIFLSWFDCLLMEWDSQEVWFLGAVSDLAWWTAAITADETTLRHTRTNYISGDFTKRDRK